jgi:hypothetical protein
LRLLSPPRKATGPSIQFIDRRLTRLSGVE